MMKRKFCFLAFCACVPVLLLSSVASAALSWDLGAPTVDIGVPVLITVSSDVGEETTWGIYLDPTSEYPSNAQMQNATILAAAGGSGSVTSGGNPDAGHDYESAGKAVTAPVAGDWSTVEFVGLAVGTYTIDLTTGGAGGTQLATADIQVVPEPSTVALLGLGSLVLLRKRRH
jgi:hypothetical protein